MIPKIAYTLCSANHLPYAKAMADSFITYNPGYKVFIGLADEINDRFDVSFFSPHIVVEVGKMNIEGLQQMSDQYTIIELNCALKSFAAQYLLQNYDPEILVYTDTDILYYRSIQPVEEALQKHDIILTPHINTPVDDEYYPKEREFLRSGLYNGGFIAMKRSGTVNRFIQWWASRLRYQGYYRLSEGMGVDQNWLNFVPIYFMNVGILRHKGANIAYWNLHERMVTRKDDTLWVNDAEPLLFLHFSGYRFETPDIMSKHQNRHDLKSFPILQTLFKEYADIVKRNRYDEFIDMSCFYARPVRKSTGIMAAVNKLLKPIGIKVTNA